MTSQRSARNLVGEDTPSQVRSRPRGIMPRGLGSAPRKLEPYIWILPALAFLILFIVFPVLFSLRLSFFEWSGFTPVDAAKWVGAKNYLALLNDPFFRRAFTNTLAFTAFTTVGLTAMAFVLAFALCFRAPRWGAMARSAIFYPAIISGVIVSITWSRLLALDGPINDLAGALTSSTVDVLWLADLNVTFWVLVVVEIWRATGIGMILYLAGMGRISSEILDSARLDGASTFQVARYVVEPLVRPLSAVIILLNVIGGLQAFTLISLMTGGGPVHSTETVATYSYWLAFASDGPSRIGYATAVANAGVLILVGIAVVRLRKVDQG